MVSEQTSVVSFSFKRVEILSMTAITGIKGREILDSRGNPTVEATVVLENGL